MRQTIMVVNSPNRIHIYIYIFVSLIPYLDALFVSFLVCTEIVHDYKSNLKTASCQTSYNRCPVSRPGMNTSVSAQQKRHAMKRVIAHTCISSGIVHFQWNLMPQTTFPPPLLAIACIDSVHRRLVNISRSRTLLCLTVTRIWSNSKLHFSKRNKLRRKVTYCTEDYLPGTPVHATGRWHEQVSSHRDSWLVRLEFSATTVLAD